MHNPNCLLQNGLSREIVEVVKKLEGYILSLRPIRRHVFEREYRLPEDMYLPEFFKPCFGVLCRKGDPEMKPCMIIEIDDVPETLKQLYSQHGIPWARLEQQGSQIVLEAGHKKTRLHDTNRIGNLYELLKKTLVLYECEIRVPQGSLVHSYCERTLRDAVRTLSPEYSIECHHQIPLGWVLGFRTDLSPQEKGLLRCEIDAVIIRKYEIDPDCTVILPVKIDIHNSHTTDPMIVQRDRDVRQLCGRRSVPLLTITSSEGGGFEFSSPVLGLLTTIAGKPKSQLWASTLKPFIDNAFRFPSQSNFSNYL
jgi:hypothetical protein